MDEISIDDLWEDLTDSEKEAWNQLQSTVTSPGWKLLARDLENEVALRQEAILGGVSTWDQYVLLQGQVDGLRGALRAEDRALAQLAHAVAERVPDPDSETPLVIPEDFA